MKFVDCALRLLHGRIKPSLPDGYTIMGYEGSSIYIGIYVEGALKEIYSADPNDLDWEVIE